MRVSHTELDADFKVCKRIVCSQHCGRCFFALCAHLVKQLCNCSSSKVLCAPFTGSQVHLRSESRRTDDCKNILHGSIEILALTVLEYSKYYASHSYWMFNNNNKQIEETKRFGKCLSNCVSFVYISLSRP